MAGNRPDCAPGSRRPGSARRGDEERPGRAESDCQVESVGGERQSRNRSLSVRFRLPIAVVGSRNELDGMA